MSKTIKMRRGCVGENFVYAAGATVENVPDDRAADLVQAEHADYVNASPANPAARAEKAVSKPAATAEKR